MSWDLRGGEGENGVVVAAISDRTAVESQGSGAAIVEVGGVVACGNGVVKCESGVPLPEA